MAVDIACRSAMSQRGVSHLTIPIDVQEMKLKGRYSRHKVGGHTSDGSIPKFTSDPENLGAPVVKALLGKAVIPDIHPVCRTFGNRCS
jgi:pyruvate dehydrogenase (quinone)